MPEQPPAAHVAVKTTLLDQSVFHYDILSNGKLSALQKNDLRFQNMEERIINIAVKNGQQVKAGQLLAEQDKFRLETILKQSEVELEQARINYKDALILHSHSNSDSASIPAPIIKTARISSGLERAELNYNLALHNYKAASLYAPFDGIIANLYTKNGNLPPVNEAFCTVLDISKFDVDFTILESELDMVSIGDKVIIESFTANKLQNEGIICEINPMVEKTGLVKVKAEIYNSKRLFFEGMNVKIKIRKNIGKQIVIPKSALVLRDGRHVVFSIIDNKAQWHYVNVELENSDSYTLKADEASLSLLNKRLIIDGVFNLAHNTPVTINDTIK
jgi:RND family efflux transporter MFP subunit